MTKPTGRQDAFDIAVRGLASQGFRRCLRQSDDGFSSQCAYNAIDRTGDDVLEMHCAAGWLIRDISLPTTHLSMSIELLMNRNLRVSEHLEAVDGGFLSELQMAHDGADGPLDMRLRLYTLAQKYGLDETVLDKAVAP